MSQSKMNKINLNKRKMKRLKEHGITLVALVVTIIIMLILAGIALNIALGDNGLIKHTIDAIDENKRASYQEILSVIKTGVDMKALSEKLSDEEHFQELKNEINKEIESGNLKGATLSVEENKLRVITKERFVYDITMDSIAYIGIQGKNDENLPNVKEGDIEITLSEEKWTKGPIIVTITPKINIENFTLQYSTDETTWQKYTAPFEIHENGTIYARVVNGLSEYKGKSMKEVTIIDRLEPSVTFKTKETINSITVEATGTDDESGKNGDGNSGIGKYYFSMNEGPWVPEGGQDATQVKENEYVFEGLNPGTTYKIKVKVKDKAGNEKVSEVKEISTKKELIVTKEVFQSGKIYHNENGNVEFVEFENGKEGLRITGNGAYKSDTCANKWDIEINTDDYKKLQFQVRKGKDHGVIRILLDSKDRLFSRYYTELSADWKDVSIDLSEYNGMHTISFGGGYVDHSGNLDSRTEICDIKFTN